MGFLDSHTISTYLNNLIPNATLYEFGILESRMHMAWMRAVVGRLKSDYRYSAKLVYNNFPWPQIPLNPPSVKEETGIPPNLPFAKGGLSLQPPIAFLQRGGWFWCLPDVGNDAEAHIEERSNAADQEKPKNPSPSTKWQDNPPLKRG